MLFSVEHIKMKELRLAETSNSAAMELMARHVVDAAGNPIPFDQALAELDEMDMTAFFTCWMEFVRAGVPNLNGRR